MRHKAYAKFWDFGKNTTERNQPGVVRASFGMYNTTEEVDALVAALVAISRGKYRGQYDQDRATGDFRPRGWLPDLSRYFSLHAGERSGATC